MPDWMQFVSGGVMAIALSAAARTMPSPDKLGRNIWYTWLYDWTQLVMINLDKSGITNGSRNIAV